jgi:hypothetical protein
VAQNHPYIAERGKTERKGEREKLPPGTYQYEK